MLLYYITNRNFFPGTEEEKRKLLLQRIREAAAAGVDYIQLREKDLKVRELETLAKQAVAAVKANSSRTRVLINQHAEVALATGAAGVHLPGESLPPSEIRALWAKSSATAPVIAVSAHSTADVRYAESHGADFAVLAPIFEKLNTSVPALGLRTFSIACGQVPPPDSTESAPQSKFPVLALGGVTLFNAHACLQAGGAGIAAIRLFQSGNLAETVRQLRQLEA
jgi:thiamine-phosphate pyrophosphorylase